MRKLGRLPRDYRRWAPTLDDYLRRHPNKMAAEGLEKVNAWDDVDRASKVTVWPMYCNGPDSNNPPASPDGIGDCTIAEMAHAFTAAGVYAGKEQVLFEDGAVINAYSAVSGYNSVTGSNDNGAQLQDVLRYMREVGMPDPTGTVHKVEAYADLRVPTDILMLSEVLKTFGYVYLGVNLPASADEQFGNQPWSYVPGSPILGGHCIGLHHRKPYGSTVGVFEMASWGALQPAEISFIQNCVDEAWAVITDDWLEANGDSCDGVSLSQLIADMKYV